MGCENCCNFNQENEISTSKIQNNNSLNKDIESKELILYIYQLKKQHSQMKIILFTHFNQFQRNQ